MTEAAPALEPSHRAAYAFRAALAALAEPGRIAAMPPLAGAAARADRGLSSAAWSLLILLSDADAPWRLAEALATPERVSALAFETASRPAERAADAAFFCGPWAALSREALPEARVGDPYYPDRGATLIVEATALEGGPDRARISGPGLAAPREIGLGGVGRDFWPWMRQNAQRYPVGMDVFVTAGDRVVGLPRSLTATPLA